VRLPLGVLGATALVAVATGCGSTAVARVGGATITRDQLEQTVEHFREEAQREGRAFPEEGSPAFPPVRNRLLGLLVYRLQLQQAAAGLGIAVGDDQVEQRLESSSPAEEDRDAQAFAAASVRAQLLTEAVYRRLADRIRAASAEDRQARRNAALQRWLARLPSRFPPRYAKGYAPG
jgi:hypothetical protein